MLKNKIKWDDLNPDDKNVVRHNMLQDVNYRPYCGNNKIIILNMYSCDNPRTIWDSELNQMKCTQCGWVSQFPADFIVRYKDIHGLE